MKKGLMQTQAVTFRNIISSYSIIAGGLCYIASFVIWLHVLKILPLSIAYPAASISYIGVIIASAVFLGEPVNLFKIIGAALIITGVFFISRAY
jgi:undecaprenyl phosphate-alpha-L-ara4N flippase subunit ArnF